MRFTEIKSCYIGPEISPEQFVPENFFLYLAKGTIHGYDGSKNYTLNSGGYCIVRKNQLVRYNKEKENDEFEKIVIVLDEVFLRKIQEKNKITAIKSTPTNTFLHIDKSELIPNFIGSLMAYYNNAGEIDPAFTDIKREELLIILLKTNPQLANVLFDFEPPEKIDLEAFMNHNYKFNVGMERFAYLTGRSLSAFKRDFKDTFNDTPNHWLVQRRLQEAHFLLDKKNKKPSDIYLDLGFEDLSHFSYAFKKQFGLTPTALTGGKKKSSR